MRSSPIGSKGADPEFCELSNLLCDLQEMDGMAIRSQLTDNKRTMVMVFRPPNNEAAAGNLKKVIQLLGLDTEVKNFPVVHRGFALNNKEIAILNRSLLQIMAEYAAYIDVPESHIAEGREMKHKNEQQKRQRNWNKSTRKPILFHTSINKKRLVSIPSGRLRPGVV